jgi:hypothetical protein
LAHQRATLVGHFLVKAEISVLRSGNEVLGRRPRDSNNGAKPSCKQTSHYIGKSVYWKFFTLPRRLDLR